MVALLAAHQRAVRGSSSVDPAAVASAADGHRLVDPPPGRARRRGRRVVAWASVHDRAAGRTVVDVTLVPDLPSGDATAAALFAWAEEAALEITRLRELDGTQLDASAYADDKRQRTWLTARRATGIPAPGCR